MRLVFANYCHPDTPHICGVRVASFARAMAVRGHRVILITRELEGHPTAPPLRRLPAWRFRSAAAIMGARARARVAHGHSWADDGNRAMAAYARLLGARP